MWVTFSSLRVRASSSLTKAFFFRRSFLAGESSPITLIFLKYLVFSLLAYWPQSPLDIQSAPSATCRCPKEASAPAVRGFVCLLSQRSSFLANLPPLSFAASCLWDSTRSQGGRNRSTSFPFLCPLCLRKPPQSHPWWAGICSFWSWRNFLQDRQLFLMTIMKPLPVLSSLGFLNHNILRILRHVQVSTKQLLTHTFI